MLSEPILRHVSAIPWSLPASLAIHLLLLATALLLAPRALSPPRQAAISVDLIFSEQFAALLAPEAEPQATPAPEPEPVVPAAAVTPPGADGDMVEAYEFYAASILGDPANGEVRDNFPLLASSEQVVQLCNIEALEQLRVSGTAIDADAVVGYAFDDYAVEGDMLRVEGGAYRSAGQWFHIRYRCSILADMTGVGRFEYVVGEAVPQSEWEEHFLNADDDGLN